MKKNLLYPSFAILSFILIFSDKVFAQKILKDTMLNVVKSFQPTIADAYKINEMPVVKDTVPPAPALNYTINSKKVFTPFNVDPLKPAKMVGEPLTKLYSSLVKIGGGNYNTPYGEAFYNNLRSKDMSYGFHLKHFSSKATSEGYGFSGLSDNQAELYGKKFLHKHTLSGNLDYNRNAVHYYGYDTSLVHPENNNATKQYYSRIGGNAMLQSHYTDSIHANYILKLKYYNLTDNYKSSENNLRAEGDFSSYYEKQLIHIPILVDYYANKFDTVKNNSTIVALNPYINSSGDKWNARIGMNIAIDAQQNNNSHFHFYPQADFNYNVVENIIVPYAGVTGGLKKNSLNTLSGENPFILPNPAMKNTSTKWEMYVGMKGSISKTVSYHARTSFSKADDMVFFVNENNYSNTLSGFGTVYDDVMLWNVHGELQYQQTEKIKFIAKADYNKYNMTNELEPWHKPLWQTTFSANYNLKSKIVVNADIFAYGKRFAYSPFTGTGTGVTITSTGIIELKTIVDANLGLEYRYSKKLSAFLNLNNLGFARYYFWNNYPTYKFNFLLGVSMVL